MRAPARFKFCTCSPHAACTKTVYDLKRKTAEVSSGRFPLKAFRQVDLRSKAARRDSAVHVSLSSDSLVNQPGTMTVPLNRQAGEPSKLHASDEDRKLWSPNISEVLRRRDIAPKGGRRAVSVYIVLPRVGCQHLSPA